MIEQKIIEFSDKEGLRACWGTDWPSTDTLNWKRETVGLGIYIPTLHRVSEQPANKDNYGYVVKATDNQLHYNLVYTSANEEFGYHQAKDWFNFLKEWKKELLSPIDVRIVN